MNPLAQEIDRLVDGEIEGGDRRALLQRLDAEPDGWKRCALAFLEAQAWRSAVASAAPGVPIVAPASKARRGISGRIWAARAAGVLVAFAVGWAAGRGRGEDRVPEVVERPRIAPQTVNPAPISQEIAPVVAAKPSHGEPAPPRPPSYARARLEREGYKVEQSIVIVPARTASGRRVAVPVEQTKVRFVGNRAI